MNSLKLNQSKNNIYQETQHIIQCINHKDVAPVECDICSCIVVHRALYNHKKTGKCKHDELKVTQTIITS